jgi:multicomponent Na+:H+ antiporter subunit G
LTVKEIVETALLVLGVAASLVCCLGVGIMRSPYDRLHFLSAMGTVGATAVVAAVLVEDGLSSGGLKAIVVLITLLVTGPVLTHAIARAAYIRERGRPAGRPGRTMERR